MKKRIPFTFTTLKSYKWILKWRSFKYVQLAERTKQQTAGCLSVVLRFGKSHQAWLKEPTSHHPVRVPVQLARLSHACSSLANIINAAIKIFVLILTPESQLINKKGNEKLKNKLSAAVGLAGSQQPLTASFNFTSMNSSHTPQSAPPATCPGSICCLSSFCM